MHFKLLTLLYEDNTVIMTEFAVALYVPARNEFQVYHMQWKSKLNVNNNICSHRNVTKLRYRCSFFPVQVVLVKLSV